MAHLANPISRHPKGLHLESFPDSYVQNHVWQCFGSRSAHVSLLLRASLNFPFMPLKRCQMRNQLCVCVCVRVCQSLRPCAHVFVCAHTWPNASETTPCRIFGTNAAVCSSTGILPTASLSQSSSAVLQESTHDAAA